MLHNTECEFESYGRHYYRNIDYKPYPIQVLKFIGVNKQIDRGHHYVTYVDGNKYYEAILTNSLSWLKIRTLKKGKYIKYRMVKKMKQMSLFDIGLEL